MPKYAIINDQHFGVNGDSEFFHENYRKFYTEIFMPSILAEKPDALIIPGDLWQSRKVINPLTLKLCQDVLFNPLLAAGIPVYIAYGNHDVYYKNTNAVNTIDFLGSMYPNVAVVPLSKELPGGVLLMSWWAPDTYDVQAKTLAETTCDIVVGHFEIEGHLMTPGYVCEHGMKQSMFERFAMVISGHFHVRGTDGRITYTSNPSQTTWADYGLEKGFHYLDTAAKTLTAVNNPFTVYEVIAWAEPDPSIDLSQYSSKIVRVAIPSYATIDLLAFKDFLGKLTEVAHKVVVVETAKIDGKSSLEAQGDVTALPIREVVVDYAREVSGELSDEVAAKVAALFEEATA